MPSLFARELHNLSFYFSHSILKANPFITPFNVVFFSSLYDAIQYLYITTQQFAQQKNRKWMNVKEYNSKSLDFHRHSAINKIKNFNRNFLLQIFSNLWYFMWHVTVIYNSAKNLTPTLDRNLYGKIMNFHRLLPTNYFFFFATFYHISAFTTARNVSKKSTTSS